MLSYYSIAIFSRRAIFIGGHFMMGALLMLTGYFIQQKQAELVLLTLSSHIIIYQATQGATLFIYIAEIANNDAIMGMCLFMMMFCTTVQSLTSTYLINAVLGIDGLFFGLGGIQFIAVFWFLIGLKETQTLSATEKKKIYWPESLRQSESDSAIKGAPAAIEKPIMSQGSQLVVGAPLLTEGDSIQEN